MASEPSFITLWSTSILDCKRASSFFKPCNFCCASVSSARSDSKRSSRVARCSSRFSISRFVSSMPAWISAMFASASDFCLSRPSISVCHFAMFDWSMLTSASMRSKRPRREFTRFVACKRSFESSRDCVRKSSTLSRMTCNVSRSRSKSAFSSSMSFSLPRTAISSSRRAFSSESSCDFCSLRSISP